MIAWSLPLLMRPMTPSPRRCPGARQGGPCSAIGANASSKSRRLWPTELGAMRQYRSQFFAGYRFADARRSKAGFAASSGVNAFAVPIMRFAAAWSPARFTDSTTTRPLLRKPKVEKAPPSTSPRRIHLSTPCERPAIASL